MWMAVTHLAAVATCVPKGHEQTRSESRRFGVGRRVRVGEQHQEISRNAVDADALALCGVDYLVVGPKVLAILKDSQTLQVRL